MAESDHVIEEMRLMRTAHLDMTAKVAEMCGSIRELVVKIDHVDKRFDAHAQRMKEQEAMIREIQLENASNKPLMDIARSMYRMQWATIVAAIGAVGGPEFLKLFGG